MENQHVVVVPAEDENGKTIASSNENLNNHVSEIIVHAGPDDYAIINQLRIKCNDDGKITIMNDPEIKGCEARLRGELAVTFNVYSEYGENWSFTIFPHKGDLFIKSGTIEKELTKNSRERIEAEIHKL
jgi:hypothetical protein